MRIASLIFYVAFSACGGEDESPPVYIPSLIYPGQLTVTKSGSTSFVLSSSDFSHGGIGGMFDPYDNDTLTATPSLFDLSPSSSSESITMTAAIDTDLMNENVPVILYIGGAITGESPVMQVLIVDTNAQNVIASDWNITMSASSITMIGVQLTQPPSVPLTITLQSSNAGVASVTPTTMVFGAADYNVSQTAAVTSFGAGTTLITLSSTLPATAVFVSVQ